MINTTPTDVPDYQRAVVPGATPLNVVVTSGGSVTLGGVFQQSNPVVGTYPAIPISVAAGETKVINSLGVQTTAGTATITVLHNGAAIAALTGIACTSVLTYYPIASVTLANGDTLAIEITAQAVTAGAAPFPALTETVVTTTTN